MVYRSREELESWKKRDPIATFRNRLLAGEWATDAELAAIDAEVQELLDEAVEFAADSPHPAPETALDGVYGDGHNGRVF